MYLSHLKIKNFRSIKNLSLVFQKGKNIIVGRNNTGKSNIIKALDIVLGEGSPTYYKVENITPLDFYKYKIKKEKVDEVETATEILIFVELTKEKNEQLNYEEIYKCFGFYKYLTPITDAHLKNNTTTIFEINVDELDYRKEKSYVNPKLKNQLPFENEFNGAELFTFVFRATLEKETETIIKDMRFFYRKNEQSDWVMAFTSPIRNEFLQSAIIPSFRDPQNQLRPTQWTWYGKLMRYLTTTHGKDESLRRAFTGVKKIADEIFVQAKNKVQSGSLDVAFPGSQIHFQFNEDFKADIYKDSKIYIDDGIKSPLNEKGSGIQSATIIGLFNFYTKYVNTITAALLCIEEPELYLHPHARRVISDRLDEFLNSKNQVILTTHSTDFIRSIEEDLNIILVQKTSNGTSAKPIKIKDNRFLLLDNNHNEVFFADKVIVCEGLDHYLLRWISKEKFPKKLDEQNISIVSVGAKDYIDIFINLLLDLDIKCFVFADFDYFLRDQGINAGIYEETIKSKSGHTKKLSKRHKSISNLSVSFFNQDCIFGNDGGQKKLEIDTFRSKLKKNQERNFYMAKITQEFANSKEIESHLDHLRKNGIGILNSEVEYLSRDVNLIAPETNKLNYDKIFEINKLLNSGKKISDLFDTKQIEDFLSNVYQI